MELNFFLAGVNMYDDPTYLLPIIESAKNDAGSKLGELLEHFQPQLKKFAEKSIGQTLRRRMSPSDLVQDRENKRTGKKTKGQAQRLTSRNVLVTFNY